MEAPRKEPSIQPGPVTKEHVAKAVARFDIICKEINRDDPDDPMRPKDFVDEIEALCPVLGEVMGQTVNLGSTDKDKMLVANAVYVTYQALAAALDPEQRLVKRDLE